MSSLKVVLSDSAQAAEIRTFDGSSGKCDRESLRLEDGSIHTCQIRTPANDLIWEGAIRFHASDTGLEFQLCISCDAELSTQKTLLWSEVPTILDVAGGGYRPLSGDQVGVLLKDLIEFSDVAGITLHSLVGGRTISWVGKLGPQDDLKSMSEILVEAPVGDSVTKDSVLILGVELFEISYFFVGLCADSSKSDVIITLTSHIYEQRRRNGRRFLAPPVICGDAYIIESSDFGCRVLLPSGIQPETSMFRLQICDRSVQFEIVHRRKTERGIELGLKFGNQSSEDRNTWSDFLLKTQYPLLRRRTQRDHESTWNLLETSGYISGGMGELISLAKDEVLREWELIDKNGIDKGSSVVAYAHDKPVATIGISNITENAWVAHAAAALADPEFIPQTRSIYAWRTRAILQRAEAKYHVACFQRDKPFLDRFFRKFYLLQNEHSGKKVFWNEWKYYAQRSTGFQRIPRDRSVEPKTPLGLSAEPLLQVISEKPNGQVALRVVGDVAIMKARASLHPCQYFTSLWISEKCETSLSEQLGELAAETGLGQAFYTIRTQREDDEGQLSDICKLGPLFYDGWEVAWVCDRDLLPAFHANSLKALEQMLRKYGVKAIA